MRSADAFSFDAEYSITNTSVLLTPREVSGMVIVLAGPIYALVLAVWVELNPALPKFCLVFHLDCRWLYAHLDSAIFLVCGFRHG